MENAKPEEGSRLSGVLLLLGGVALLLFAAVVVARIAGPLAGMIAPPNPPVPEGAEKEISRHKEAGIDEWVYATEMNACDVLAFYEDRGGSCIIDESACISGETQSSTPDGGPLPMGRCSGAENFSIFSYRWEVYVHYAYPDGLTRFVLARDVNWLGGTGE